MIGLKDLCTPSYVYLVISMFALLIIGAQNIGNVDTYCIGSYKCDVTSTYIVFIVKVFYILFWTWILNIMCKNGSTNFAWLLVLLPFVLLFIMLGMFILSSVPTLKLI